MKQEEYRACISNALKGKSFTSEERKLEFCIASKFCSKGFGRAEAEKICREQPPKEPKPRKSRLTGKSCSPQSLDTITNCILARFNFNASDMNKELRDNLAQCMCGRKEKKLSKAEQAVMALDPGQQAALIQFMTEHGTSAKRT